MKKPTEKGNEKETQAILIFALIAGAAADVLCVLYLLNAGRYQWFLTLIQALAVMLHAALFVFGLVKRKLPISVAAGIGTVLYAASLCVV